MAKAKWRNNKTGDIYVVDGEGIDCTNERDGTIVVLYHKFNERKKFVRERNEFLAKFTKIDDILSDLG